MMSPENNLQDHILEHLPVKHDGKAVFSPVSGGSINTTWQIDTDRHTFFCKINNAKHYPGLFEIEAAGLNALKQAGCIKVPEVIAVSNFGSQQVLILEYIKPGSRTTGFWELLGQQLAKLHSVQQTRSGFEHDNYMGALPQQNEWTNDWHTFFRDKRLKPQIELARQHGLLSNGHVKLFEKLYDRLPEIFTDEPASLLHGDLWSGNFLCNTQQEPVLIDPAVYYGNSSMDLAMTTLFGGFHKKFYDAYAWWRPFPSNYEEQWQVCNMYPLLIHLNLFGSSYLASIEAGLRRFH
ncbi:MAG TPA: fructosamine kinase family protein [Chitinophagaceae bacterium]|nr:fructosamine kinase family protein [Chitinophagaceae bacterium]